MFNVSTALAAAQMAATLARINDGPGPAKLELYTTPRPVTPDTAAGIAAQVVIELATPAGSITDGVLSLTPASAGGALVLTDGIPRWGRVIAADGVALADGDVTDVASGGDITLLGGTTPAGDNSPQLYAGGLVILGTIALT